MSLVEQRWVGRVHGWRFVLAVFGVVGVGFAHGFTEARRPRPRATVAKAGPSAVCPAGARFDGANCHFGAPPRGGKPFIYGAAFYYKPLAGPKKCHPPARFDSANCHYRDVPAGWKPFLHAGGYYVQARSAGGADGAGNAASSTSAKVAMEEWDKLQPPPVPAPRDVTHFRPPKAGPAQGGEGAADEPTALVRLASAPAPIDTRGLHPESEPEAMPLGSDELGRERQRALTARDKRALPHENLKIQPSEFCVGQRCFRSYNEVASALYGRGGASQPVFCAPVRLHARRDPNPWSARRVSCHKSWLATLGGWQPWTAGGLVAAAPKLGVVPPYACFAHPRVTGTHMVLPAGGAGPSGFACRQRIFKVPVNAAQKSAADENRAIALMCAQMRQQVWGEKYPRINDKARAECRKNPELVQAGLCLSKKDVAAARAKDSAGALPYFRLTREELLYFFGHQELYCRADRKGLVHRFFNDKWARTFTCGVPRGVLDSGPFEEGVQACAIAPFVGTEGKVKLRESLTRARLHCWKFGRPTCEEMSRKQTKEDLYQNQVFDVLDILREVRRTQEPKLWSYLDLKDAEAVPNAREKRAYPDSGQDEGTFGVDDFCRFVGDRKQLRCGYTRDSIAQWYELRRGEAPAGCVGGVCKRGQFERGYLCGLFRHAQLFSGRPYWMCGIDNSDEGRKLLARSGGLCIGGAPALAFQSASGTQKSLLCFQRRFKWGESRASGDMARSFTWAWAVREGARVVKTKNLVPLDPALLVKAVAIKAKTHKARQQVKHISAMINAKNDEKKRAYERAFEEDAQELVAWAKRQPNGHSMGHRTNLRIWTLASVIKFIKDALWDGFPEREPLKENQGGKEPPRKPRALLAPETIPDAEWYMEVRDACIEDGKVIHPTKLEKAFRVHRGFMILENARRLYASKARAYAIEVAREGKNRPLLSRFEVAEIARHAERFPNEPAPYHCVMHGEDASDAGAKKAAGPRPILCARSSMLVAGELERAVREAPIAWAKDEEGREVQRAKMRGSVPLTWCYGAAQGFDPTKDPAMPPQFAPRTAAGSPYQLDVPEVVQGGPAQKRAWMRCQKLQFNDELWAKVTEDMLKASDKKNAAPPRDKGKEASGIMKIITSLLRQVASLVAPKFAKALDRVADIVNVAAEFLDKWKDKFAEVAGPFWQKQQEAIEAAETKKQEALKELEEKKEDQNKAELAAAVAQGPAKEQAEKARDEAKALIVTAKQKVSAAEANLKATITKVRKGTAVPGTGELLGQILEDLIKTASERVMSFVEPHARNLLGKVMKFLRGKIDKVADAIINSLSGVPMVGGVLVAAASMLYKAGMDWLEEQAYTLVSQLVETLLNKVLRAVMTPILKAVQGKLLALVYAVCTKLHPSVCGGKDYEVKFSALPARDQWIDRALACSAPPIDWGHLEREAVAAEANVRGIAADLERNAGFYARDLAERVLAGYGVSYNEVLAMAKSDAARVRLAALRDKLQMRVLRGAAARSIDLPSTDPAAAR